MINFIGLSLYEESGDLDQSKLNILGEDTNLVLTNDENVTGRQYISNYDRILITIID